MQGAGDYAISAYGAAYLSTLASSRAACLGGATFTAMQSKLSGVSDPNATANATEYCRRLAVRDAIEAGHNAADAATPWITITQYGAGARPKLDGATTANAAIIFPTAVGGGWKVQGIDILNYRVAGVYYNSSAGAGNAAALGQAISKGLTLEDVTFTDITGMPLPTFPSTTPQVGGFGNYFPWGAVVWNVGHVHLKNTNFVRAGALYYLTGSSHHFIENSTDDHSRYYGAAVQFATNVLVKGGSSTFACNGPALQSGSAAIELTGTNDVIVSGWDAGNVQRPGGITPDGVAIDNEGGNTNTTVLSSNLHDNQGEAFLFFNNPATNNPPGPNEVGTMVVDTVVNNNGLFAPTTLALVVRYSAVPNDLAVFVRNTFTRNNGTQKYFKGIASGNFDDVGSTGWVIAP